MLPRRALVPHPTDEALRYAVELWDLEGRAVDEVLARSSTASVGHAALEADVAMRPGRLIKLREGLRLIDQHEPDA